MTNQHPAIVKVMKEISQHADTRQSILKSIEGHLGDRCVIAYFTSFNQQVIIDSPDVDIVEGVLQQSDTTNGLTMIVNSPGGDGLAAEQMINVCRSYSNDDFEVIVPKAAKSAATMICLGAKKICMSKTAELGPIDPQVSWGNSSRSAHSIIASYEELLEKAVDTKGNLHPYLQQLGNFDPSDIMDLRASQELSESIAVNALSSGMLAGQTDDEIRQKIKVFTDPNLTSSHGRRIGIDKALECGLSVEEIPLRSPLWELLWEFYVRADNYTSTDASKLVESKEHHFHSSAVQ